MKSQKWFKINKQLFIQKVEPFHINPVATTDSLREPYSNRQGCQVISFKINQTNHYVIQLNNRLVFVRDRDNHPMYSVDGKFLCKPPTHMVGCMCKESLKHKEEKSAKFEKEDVT